MRRRLPHKWRVADDSPLESRDGPLGPRLADHVGMHESLILTRSLRTAGETTLGIERGARSGRFVRVRPGAYVPTDEWQRMSAELRHRVAMDALAATSRRPVVFAVESAAALLGIPLVGGWPTLPRVAVGLRPPRRSRVDVSMRWRPVPTDDVVSVSEMLATCPARTAIDLAAERDLASGVAAFDHVMRVHGQTRDAIRSRIDADRPFRGARKADAALALATGRAEGPFESLSLTRIHQLGFEAPEQQVEFVIDGILYRCDFYWPRLRLIGEADGRSKYGDFPGEALWREKQREDALRSVVDGLVRWGWADAWAGHPLALKLERAGLHADPRIASKYAFSS